MPQYLICIYHIEGESPYYLHKNLSEVMRGVGRPDLYIAAKIHAPSIDELQEVVWKARWITLDRYGFAFADKVSKTEYGLYHFSPFLKRIPADIPVHPFYLYRGDTACPDFFTEIHDGWKYQDADFDIKLLEDTVSIWNRQDIVVALRFYEQWLLSEDGQKFAPDNRECFFLRECLELNRIAAEIVSTDTIDKTEPENTPKQSLSDRYKKCAERQLALDSAVQIILETMLANLPFPKLTDVANKVFADGFAINPETYNKRLSEEKVIKALKSQAVKRPQSTIGKAYRQWRENLMQTLDIYGVPLIQNDQAGLEGPKSLKSRSAKKKAANESETKS
jgi:hypothetical protein